MSKQNLKKKKASRSFYAFSIATFLISMSFMGMFFVAPELEAAKNANSGAIWTTTADCAEVQNANSYAPGEAVYLRGRGFSPDIAIDWEIIGLKSSNNPDIVVASGVFNADSEGAFCTMLYTVAENDAGGYKVHANKKHDNYKVTQAITPPECDPIETRACYSGPEGTLDVGICSAGVQNCTNNGQWEDTCVGEILPQEEICDNNLDDNCNGEVDENCVVTECEPTEIRDCYSGPAGTQGIGICQAGIQTCDLSGFWGACMEEILPQTEVCDNNLDDNCDGEVDEGCFDCYDPDGDLYGEGPDCLGPDCNPEVYGMQFRYCCFVDEDNDIFHQPYPYIGNDGVARGEFCYCTSGDIHELCSDLTTTNGEDCDDTNALINPGMTEDCSNGIDDDCDLLADCDDPDCSETAICNPNIGTIRICNYADKNRNFILDAQDTPVEYWPYIVNGMPYVDIIGNDCLEITDLPFGTYTIYEDYQRGWGLVGRGGDGVLQSDGSIVVELDSAVEEVYFLNLAFICGTKYNAENGATVPMYPISIDYIFQDPGCIGPDCPYFEFNLEQTVTDPDGNYCFYLAGGEINYGEPIKLNVYEEVVYPWQADHTEVIGNVISQTNASATISFDGTEPAFVDFYNILP